MTRRLRSDDSGQALALGTMALLVLALGMYLIGSYGRHVQQKIHVQTTADAVALSLAQAEAESFNFIAFSNRAQVAHYVAALNLQAYVSYFSWLEVTLVTIANYAEFIARPMMLVPVTAAAGAALHAVAQTAFEGYQALSPLIDPLDRASGVMLNRVGDLNRAIWVSEMWVAMIVAAELGTGGHELFRQAVERNDPEWATTNVTLAANAALSAYNVYKYNQAFFSAAGGAPPIPSADLPKPTSAHPGTSDIAVAQRVMTEVVNATRNDHWEVDRGLLPFAGPIGVIIDKIFDAIGSVGILEKRGESKLVDRTDLATIFRANGDDSALNRGGVMASDDVWNWLPGWGTEGSVWARDNNTSEHCRAKQGESLSGVLKSYTDCQPQTVDTNHKWAGIAPYMSYQVGKRDAGANEDFHQPDVFVWLHKSKEQAGFTQAIDFTLTAGGESAHIDTQIARTGFFGQSPGVHAFARAQAYYHRPNNWAEPPNLFNPFWRARLAAVAQGIPSVPLAGEGTAANTVFQFLGQFTSVDLLITH